MEERARRSIGGERRNRECEHDRFSMSLLCGTAGQFYRGRVFGKSVRKIHWQGENLECRITGSVRPSLRMRFYREDWPLGAAIASRKALRNARNQNALRAS